MRGKDRKLLVVVQEVEIIVNDMFPSPCGEKIENYTRHTS
ncbi:hypothetical protein PL11201_700005 [Planktothrix sp. PCC 11201]|nr:hypothetical protein PL11201_700005 [Planktothrix sp. PCC 11201]